jgi:hypothetical protein
VRLAPKALWVLLALFALVNAVGALRYLLPQVPFPSQIDNFSQGRFALTGEVWGAGILIGQSD